MINVKGGEVDIGQATGITLIEEGSCALLAVCDLLYQEDKNEESVRTAFAIMVGMAVDDFQAKHGIDLVPDDDEEDDGMEDDLPFMELRGDDIKDFMNGKGLMF